MEEEERRLSTEQELHRRSLYQSAVNKLETLYKERNPLVNSYQVVSRIAVRINLYSAATLTEIVEKLTIPMLPIMEYTIHDYAWNEATLRDALNLRDALSEEYEQHDQMMINIYLQSLQHYQGLCPQQDDYYPSRRAEQAGALITVVKYLQATGANVWRYPEGSNRATPIIIDDALRALLLAPDTDLGTVLHFITERGVLDAVALRALMNNTAAHSLASGSL